MIETSVVTVDEFLGYICDTLESDIKSILKDDTISGKEFGGSFFVALPDNMNRKDLEVAMSLRVTKMLEQYRNKIEIEKCILIPPRFSDCFISSVSDAEEDKYLINALPYIKLMKIHRVSLF